MKERLQVILKFAKPHWGKFIVLFSCIILTTFSGAVYPYIFGRLVDEVFYSKNMSVFLSIVLIYGAVYLINQLMHFALNMSWAALMTKFLFDIRTAIFNKVLSYRGERLAGLYSGDVIARMGGDTEHFMNFIHWNVFYTAGGVLNLLLSIAFIGYLNIWIALLAIALTPIVVYASRYYAKKAKVYYDKIAAQNGRLSSWLFEIIKGMQDIRLLNAGRHIIADYTGKTIKIMRLKVEYGRVEVTSERVNSGITLLSQLVLYVLAAIFIVNGNLTLGGFTACSAYFGTCIAVFNTLNGRVVNISSDMVAIDRVIELLNEESEDEHENYADIKIDRGDIAFENISFSYSNGVEVLKDVSLHIPAGTKLSIVGKSGVGKTTLVNLVYRLYEPKAGHIRIDGHDLNDFNLRNLRAQIGIVHQENIFFDGTVRFNVCYGNDTCNDDRVWDALRRANMFDFIKSFPDGLDMVMERGTMEFSGGQKQRLAIARIFYKDPRILIFDEATSSLDSEAEEAVKAAWDEICRNRTTIIIAHRLSTILNSDRIIVIKDGSIEDVGRHFELMEACPHYAELFREQYSSGEAADA